jgi:PAS domain S-box-containing protein
MQALVAAMGDAVVVCDVAGRVVVWNAGAERIFGWSSAEALGQRMDMIVPERLRKRHWDGYDQSMRTGHTRYAHDVLRVPAVDKAGRAMSIAFTVFMLYGPSGEPTACGSVIRDETDRFAQDRALKQKLAALEAQLAKANPETHGMTPAAAAIPDTAPEQGPMCPHARAQSQMSPSGDSPSPVGSGAGGHS